MRKACARFEQYLKRRFGQSSTSIHYISDLNIFLHTIDDKKPEAVSVTDIDTFIDRQIANGRSPATINRRLSTIHSFFEFLAGEKPELRWPNPVIQRRHQIKTGSRLPRDVTDEDVSKLFAVISDERDRAMFGLMVGAGLRVGEVATLRLENIEAPIELDGLARLRVCGKGNKERIVWLTTSLWQTLQAWLQVRPEAETTYLFLNRQNKPIRVNGIQYRLAQHCMVAEVTLSCHRLRHTFARRMVENGMSVDSLAKLLGHSDLKTTQRYIDGADPTVRHDFTEIMKQLETSLIRDRKPPALPAKPQLRPSPKPRAAPEADLQKLRRKLTMLPNWLAEAVDAYLSWHWITWRAQTAYAIGSNLVNGIQRIWTWLAAHRQIDDWSNFNRPDLEAWLTARHQDGVTDVTIRNDLARFRSLLKFLEERDYPIDPGLFRIQSPKQSSNPLPRYLSETDYRWLENNILQATEKDTYNACFDRAWVLMLAHTGIRLSELLDLRLDDVNLGKGFATIRGGKPGRDRVVYLTPRLVNALTRYLHRRPDLPEIDQLFVLRERSPTCRTIQRRLTAYGEQVGVEVSPHRLRHTMATRLINRGMPIHSLRKLLGHQHLSTTQLYARIYDDTLYKQFQEAMSQLEIDAVEEEGIYLNDPVMALSSSQ